MTGSPRAREIPDLAVGGATFGARPDPRPGLADAAIPGELARRFAESGFAISVPLSPMEVDHV